MSHVVFCNITTFRGEQHPALQIKHPKGRPHPPLQKTGMKEQSVILCAIIIFQVKSLLAQPHRALNTHTLNEHTGTNIFIVSSLYPTDFFQLAFLIVPILN